MTDQTDERIEDQQENFFELADFRDLFWKCYAELKPALTLSDQKQRCYAIFSLSLSLNHLFDWVLNDPNVNDDLKRACIQTFNPYRKKADERFKKLYATVSPYPKRNDAQYLIREVANRAKHLKRNPKPMEPGKDRDAAKKQIHFQTLKTESYLGCGDPRAYCGSPVAVAGYHTIETTYFVEGDDGEPQSLSHLCADLVQEWGAFLRKTRLIFRGVSPSGEEDAPST